MKLGLLAVVCSGVLVACSSSNGRTTGATSGASTSGSTAVGTTGRSATTSASVAASSSGTTASAVSGTSSGSVSTSGTGTTSGAAGSTSGTTSAYDPGADGGMCQTAASGLGTFDFQQCSSNDDCTCPEICANDPTIYDDVLGAGSGLVCTYPCHTSSDCPDPQTSCQAGACLTNICAADGGPYFGPCDAQGTGDGTCVPSTDDNGNIFGECLQTGTATIDCNPLATRLDGGPLCVAGTVCAQTLDGGLRGVCQPQCDPTLTVSMCDAGQVCSGAQGANGETLYVPGNTPHSGQCYPVGTNGCAEDLPTSAPTELFFCASNADCACPQSCVNDPGQNASVCEIPCTNTSTDCPTLSTSCQSGYCNQNYCDTTLTDATAPGSFDGPCNAAGTNDGTCVAEVQTDQSFLTLSYAYGLCFQAGSLASQASCDVTIDLRDAGAAALCTVDTQCIQYDENGDTACLPLCNPVTFFGAAADGGPECPAGQGCFGLWSDEYPGVATTYGACAACTADAGSCGTASECCAPYTCSDAGPDNGYLCQ